MNTGVQQILALIGIVLFGILTLAMLVMVLITKQVVFPLLAGLVFLVLTIASGLIALRNLRDRTNLSTMGEERARIVRFARSRDGRLTAEEAAHGCSLSVIQARALLDDMVLQGSADTWVTDAGNLVYVLRGFLEAEERASAEDPMKFLDA